MELVMFTSKSCIKCKILKRDLETKKIQFQEIYIDQGQGMERLEIEMKISNREVPKALPVLLDIEDQPSRMFVGDDALKYVKSL